MRLVSIDLETTGLDPRCCDIIEFGAVAFDSDKPDIPVEELPTFHAYIVRAVYQGEPFALGMHAAIFKRIADREPGFTYLGKALEDRKLSGEARSRAGSMASNSRRATMT